MKWIHKISHVKVVNRDEFLIKYSKGKSLLHLGFVDSDLMNDKMIHNKWLHSKLHCVCSELWGVDIDKKGILKAKKHGYNNVKWGNVEKPSSLEIDKRFDIVLAADIIEHLSNVKGLLETIRLKMKRNGVGIITTPNAMRYYNPIIAIFGYELVHPKHTMWLSIATIRFLVENSGFEILEIYMFQNTNKFKPVSQDSLFKKIVKTPIYLFDLLVSKTIIRLFPLISDGLVVVFR